ncbi:signal peptidase II [Thermosulfidibacter takaii ABI70S6]|uniref:Lipoprotein signal peptidase n=1 Tax=Thermosulfidibacter takaii (strain DSM 17441 / JCM 13301 / NBRC 103674 / ABI70S6) TaxID=1298851 RepID=A0A0S3QSY2_THET7|nr:signal peptidase II [Thermosulfidibacter takaii]BAT71423.1 signal peptidase II [Thermosulfidibacter takaii ABI70S6]
MNRWVLFSISALVVFGLDRLTKVWVLKEVAPKGIIKVTSFFNIVYVTNTGGAFGIGRHGNGNLFVIASIVAILVVLYLLKKIKDGNFITYVSLGMILGGGLGNLFDRFVYGSVIDFLDFHIGNAHWPAFNVADSCIVVGVIMFALFHRRTSEES